MRLSGEPTWLVSSGDGSGTFALFVRDALGISTPAADSVPPLTPPVPRFTGALIPPGIVEDWDRWWRDCTSTGHGREPLGLPVELREAYRDWSASTSQQSTRWRNDFRTGFSSSIQEVVAGLEQELGRRLVFTLDVVEIPVEGQFWRRIERDRVLVSSQLMGSRNVIAPLESVIRDLVQ